MDCATAIGLAVNDVPDGALYGMASEVPAAETPATARIAAAETNGRRRARENPRAVV
jgi:hypothetical protein